MIECLIINNWKNEINILCCITPSVLIIEFLSTRWFNYPKINIKKIQ